MSDSDSSDSEQLPVFDFSQSKIKQTELVVLDHSDSEMAPVNKPVTSEVCCPGGAAGSDVLMVSSDSEEEEAMIPLAVRLKQKQRDLASAVIVPEKSQASSSLSNGRSQLLNVPVTLPPLYISELEDQPVERSKICTNITRQFSSVYNAPYLTEEPPPAAENGTHLAKRKKTPAEVEAARQEALRKRATREQQQEEKERLRLEKKAMADAVKALRPEECIKHMVVTVDPGGWDSLVKLLKKSKHALFKYYKRTYQSFRCMVG